MCQKIEGTPNLMEGWGCCRCRGYNGMQRYICRNCILVKCGLREVEAAETRCTEVYTGPTEPKMHGTRCARGIGHTVREPDSMHLGPQLDHVENAFRIGWWSEAQKKAQKKP